MEHHTYLKSFSIIHRFGIMFHIRKLKKFHISGHQMGYVAYICAHPGTSQERLAASLGLNKGAVTKGIRPLLQEGYIQRIQNEQDRRAYQLYPTEKAQKLYEAAEKTTQCYFEILTKGMSCEEIKLFQNLLARACDNVMEAAGEDRHHLTRSPSSNDRPCGC